MIKIYYPTKSFLTPKEKNNPWYSYILKGFEQIGQVVLSEEMSKFSTSVRGDTITVLEIDIDGKRHRVFYDWADFMVDKRDRAKEQNALYFKIQAYEDLLPIGQTVTNLIYFDKLDILRKIKDCNQYPYDVIGLFSTRRGENGGRRIKAVEIVKNIPYCKSFVGLQKRSPKHEAPKKLIVPKIGYVEHLVKQAQTKLSLVFAGVGEYNCAFSWRLSEALGIGCAIITHSHNTIYPNHKYFEKNCVITVNPDLSDMQDKIEYYMNHDKEREIIAKNGREYFNTYLTPKAMAENIIQKVKNII